MTARLPSVFVGKPCDVAGLSRACRLMAGFVENIALAVGFFCAGMPSTQGTLELLERNGIAVYEVGDLRYRGMGWPGLTTVHCKGRSDAAMTLTYAEAWGFVQRFRPFKCYLCPDLTAEAADISVGDPWYREVGDHEPGRSIILIGTEKGREIFHRAMDSGYVEAIPATREILYRSQVNLLGKRQAIWGRVLAMKALGIPAPRLEGFQLFQNWRDLPLREQIKSIAGTDQAHPSAKILQAIEI